MRVFSIIVLLSSAQLLFSQVIPEAESGQFNMIDGQVAYQEVIEVDSASQEDLYRRARLWFASRYKNSDEVLELDDPALGILQGAGFSEIINGVQLWMTTKLEVKAGRYRYTINNITVKIPPSQYIPNQLEYPVDDYYQRKKNKRIRANTLQLMQDHIDSIKAAMARPKALDDW